jgi:hypothetical protein
MVDDPRVLCYRDTYPLCDGDGTIDVESVEEADVGEISMEGE